MEDKKIRYNHFEPAVPKSKPVHKYIKAFVIIVCTLSILAGCGGTYNDDKMIEQCIDDFVYAVNVGDIDGALMCVDKRSQRILDTAINISDGLIASAVGVGISMTDIFGLGMNLIADGDIFDIRDMNIEYTSDNTARVSCTLEYDYKEKTESEKITIYMLYEDDIWVIDGKKSLQL